MKLINSVLAAVLLAGSPLLADEEKGTTIEKVQPAPHSFQLGTEVIQKIRADYQAGKYNDFLQDMDKAYQNAKKENQLEGLIQFRKESATDIPLDQFIKKSEVIHLQKEKELLAAIEDEGNSVLGQKVKSAIAPVSDSFYPLNQLRQKAPGSGKNADENKLIDIDFEHEFKASHLDSLVARGEKVVDRKEKHIVLAMQKMDKMLAAAKSFSDEGLKSLVEQTHKGLDTYLAKRYDLTDLNALANGKIKPSTALEEKIASTLSKTQDKIAELNRDLFSQLSDKEVKK
ncbi:MAG: hypothetical protein KGJ02_07260 [Verrucomicrobiota bacterium]|nr:hypothetical protein [Verrucomicrobiota bacterium]